MRKSCKTKHLSMVLSADYVQIQMKLPILQTPLAFKVLQENHMNLDAAAEFTVKSFGYSKTLHSSNFWCLILLFLHLGLNVPVLYVCMLFNIVWLCREMWAVLVKVNFLVFLVVSLGLCETCSLLPHWLTGTTNQNSYAVTLTSARMFGSIMACPLEIIGFLSVFGCIWQKAAYHGLWGCSIWQGFGNLGTEVCEVPQHTAQRATWRAWMKSVHQKGAGRLALCPQPSQLRLCQTSLLGAHPCWSSAGAEGKPSTQTMPPGNRKGGRLPEYTATTGRAGFQISAFSNCGRGEWEPSFRFVQQLCAGGRAAARSLLQPLAVSDVCRAMWAFLLITFWAECIKFFIKMSLSCRWQNEGYFRQAVEKQSLAMSKNQTGKR